MQHGNCKNWKQQQQLVSMSRDIHRLSVDYICTRDQAFVGDFSYDSGLINVGFASVYQMEN